MEKYDSKVSIEIFNNSIQIVSFRKLQGILIENSDIADTMKQIFNMTWKFLEKEEADAQEEKD